MNLKLPDSEPADAVAISAAIASGAQAVVPSFLPDDLVMALRTRAKACDAAGEFVAAGVGRGATRAMRSEERGDRIRWIDDAPADGAERAFLAAVDVVRRDVNRSLALGAFALEAHYAIYPPGAGYRRHLDRFRDDDARVLSIVAYLNDAWKEGDGGALRLHLPSGTRDVLPVGGTLVAFLSASVEHEVLPARRERLAITGWFRRR